MRLICPNCGAQYEVEDSVIPDEGRDVQCSNCGHTWYQRPAHMDEALAEELDQELDSDATPPDEGDAEDIAPEEDTAPEDDDKPARERRGLDPEITDVLREEAALEAAARRGEGAPLETQTELGLDNTDERAAARTAAARARMARLRGVDENSPEAAAAALAAAGAPRRDLLPDIEEINSSLNDSQDRGDTTEDTPVIEEITETPKPRRSGFRAGFMLVVLLAIAAVAVYVLAPQIIELVPQSEPYLIDYVAFANDLRAQVSQGVDTGLQRLWKLVASVTG